jgi:hypothetical protein
MKLKIEVEVLVTHTEETLDEALERAKELINLPGCNRVIIEKPNKKHSIYAEYEVHALSAERVTWIEKYATDKDY